MAQQPQTPQSISPQIRAIKAMTNGQAAAVLEIYQAKIEAQTHAQFGLSRRELNVLFDQAIREVMS